MARRKNVHDTIFKTFLVIFVAGEALLVFRLFIFSFEPVYPTVPTGPIRKADATVALQGLPGEMWARYHNREYGFTLRYPVFGNWPTVGESEAKDGSYISLGNWKGTFGARKEESFVLFVHGNDEKISFKNWFMETIDPKRLLVEQGSVIVADLKNDWKLRYISKPFSKTYLASQAASGFPICRYYLSSPSATYFIGICSGESSSYAAHGFDSTAEQSFIMEVVNSLSES